MPSDNENGSENGINGLGSNGGWVTWQRLVLSEQKRYGKDIEQLKKDLYDLDKKFSVAYAKIALIALLIGFITSSVISFLIAYFSQH